ncbi:MAG: hypothetical protein ACFFBD_26465 [Candidatus Hodarchaeota archaeon]
MMYLSIPYKVKKIIAITFLASFIVSFIIPSLSTLFFLHRQLMRQYFTIPTQVLRFHVQLSDADWQTIRYDETFDI